MFELNQKLNYLINYIYFLILDYMLYQMAKRSTAQACSGRIVGGMKIMQRTGIIKAVREMYVTYRKHKWQQIQTLVHIIMDNLGHDGEDMPDEDSHNNHEVIIIAKAMSLDFCELNRFC